MKVLAKVNGREITQADFDAFYHSLGQQVQSQFAGEQGKERLLDELIYQELFYSEAVDTKVEETEDFQREMVRMKDNLLKQYNIKTLIESVHVTDEEAESFYAENPQFFKSDEQVKASHILVDTVEEAQKIKGEIASGLTFADAAKQYSKCPSNAQGGDLGFFQKGQMVPEFENVAFEMVLDAISEPVQTQFGFHLIQKTGHTEAAVQGYDVVKPQIMHQLLVQKQNKAYSEKVEALKAKYTVEKI